ncbi:PAS domain S-box protein [Leptospira biflexa]|uniref:PAS domain-containing sensor histidine kinase n=2 Tax=Leptospira biflexa TaxID=172 RepID=UPI0010916A14|nr:PAS domain-containing sensor histidine kinase [Leptospira biflexa]TGM47832.1 PAS domain S-box protein [Leptospira biflexa]TGM49702.1 PAS domain S-box protein [Leptospira biflexa]
MIPFELDVIFAVTILSVTFNSVIAFILFHLSKNSKSEIKLNYTSFFIAVFVLRNFMLFLFGTSKNKLFYFFAESLTLFSSYLIIASVMPIIARTIRAKWINTIMILFYITFVSLLLSGVDFFWLATPTSIFNGIVLLSFGIITFNLKEYPTMLRSYFLLVCTLLALQRLFFPYLFTLEKFLPLGYTLSTLFMFLFGVACILFSFQVQTKKLNLSLFELETLQKAIKDVNVRLLIMYNQLPAIIYNIEFIPEPRTSYISSKMEEITGYGINYFYENSEFFRDIVIQEDQHKIEELFAGKSPIILRMIHANGSIIWTEHYVNISNDILGIKKRIDVVALDITNSKKTEISLLQEKNLNSTVFDNAANLILLTNSKGYIENINPAALRVLHLTKEDVLNKYIQNIILVEEDREFLKEVLDDINEIQNIAESLILRYITKNKQTLYLEWRLGIIRDAKNEPSKIIWIGIDQTSKRTAELELKELNKSLEEKVKARTLELQNSNTELNSALFALREAQEKLIQNEKLASLGQLVSGLSHEINNPIGMIKSSVETLIAEWEEESYDFQNQTLNEILNLIIDSNDTGLRILTGISNRQARKSLSEVFKQNEILFPEELAELFVDSGIRNLSPSILNKIKTTITNQSDFKRLRKFLLMKQSSEHILYSIRRLSKITFTLKNFAGLQSNLELIDFSLIDTIHSAISLYKEYFLRDINLILNLDFDGKIRCIQGDLVQLWSQMIWNGIQAVSTKGTIWIRSFKSSDSIVVEIEDSGIGIPSEHHSKIFMPFFSTKTSGDGLGLGLYLVKEIVNRHNANISFESAPGRTIFRVSFPITM